MSKERALCPNCGAYGLSVGDHDTGEPSPDKWRCDTISGMDQQPNFLLTYQAAKAIQAVLVNSNHFNLATLLND